jgi:fatty-acyl-CoA synthase
MSILASDWIAFHADRTPDKLALIDQHTQRQYTYGQLDERAARLATFLRDEWGVVSGDRVAILAKNCSEYFEFQFACWKLGAMMLPLNWRLAEVELLFILNDSGAKRLVYDADFAERIPTLLKGIISLETLQIGEEYEQALASSPPDVVMNPNTTHDIPMTIMYTAGTTGNPKGVLITHGMTLWNAINISTPTGLNCDSVHYVVLPTFHTGGLNLYANPVFHHGGTVIVARQFEPQLALDTLSNKALGVTHFFGVPSVYLFMSQHEAFESTDLSGVKNWGCGGAPMPVTLLQHYAARDIIIQTGFGMTETSPTVFLSDKRRSLAKPASVGKPLLHTRVRIVDDHLNDVPTGEVGEVVISGPNITPGYWNRPDANETSFWVDEHGNRWLHSGDAGMMDDEGCIFIVDRFKDMYISGGENVYPAEVEQVLYQLPEVAEAAVIGVADEKWGEAGMAVVVLKADMTLSAEQVFAHCGGNLAKFKTPRHVVFIEQLPRNAAGKVLKRVLREELACRTPSS